MKYLLRVVLAVGMVGAGLMHLIAPHGFRRTIPRPLPAPAALVGISGVFEILGGAGLLVPWSRRLAAWGLVALFVAVFPANVNMAVNRIGFRGRTGPVWLLWARLPLQAVLVGWAYSYTRR